MQPVVDQLSRLGKRELIRLLLLTCNYVALFGEVSSSSGCLAWATFILLWHSLSLPYNYSSCREDSVNARVEFVFVFNL